MPKTVRDEALEKGLRLARKRPCWFALIIKVLNVAQLQVQVKEFRPQDLQRAKSDARATSVVVGVVQGEGNELVFYVTGEEPPVPLSKFRTHLDEAGDYNQKARFAVVEVLPTVAEDGGGAGSPSGSASAALPVDAAAHKARLGVALQALAFVMQQASNAQPTQRSRFQQAAQAAQKALAAGDLVAAQAAAQELGSLLFAALGAKMLSGTTPRFVPPKLTQVRSEWLSLRDSAVADLRRVQQQLRYEFSSDAAQAAPLAQALARLDTLASGLAAPLAEQIDAALAAPAAQRGTLAAQAKATLQTLVRLLDDPLVRELDGNELLGDAFVALPLRAKLIEIHAFLG